MSEDKATLDVLEAVGRRAIDCTHWIWQDGMKAIVPAPHEGGTGYTFRLEGGEEAGTVIGGYPDFTDAATLGCLVGLVREATGKPHLFCSYRREGFWGVADHDAYLSHFVTTEAEAWVEVLEESNVG
jgi:hypothetical protein